MLKKFINWFKENHCYSTKYVDFNYFRKTIMLTPSIAIMYNAPIDNGLYIKWLQFSIWFHSELY